MGERSRRPLLPRYAQDPRFDCGPKSVLPSGARLVREREHAARDEAALPAGDEAIGHAERGADSTVAGAVAEQEHTPSAAGDAGGRRRGAHEPLEILTVRCSERELHRRCKHADAHCKTDAIRTLLSIH